MLLLILILRIRFHLFFVSLVKWERRLTCFSQVAASWFRSHLSFELSLLNRMVPRLQHFRWDRLCSNLILDSLVLLTLLFSDHPLYFTLSNWLWLNLVSNFKSKWFGHCNPVSTFLLILDSNIILSCQPLLAQVLPNTSTFHPKVFCTPRIFYLWLDFLFLILLVFILLQVSLELIIVVPSVSLGFRTFLILIRLLFLPSPKFISFKILFILDRLHQLLHPLSVFKFELPLLLPLQFSKYFIFILQVVNFLLCQRPTSLCKVLNNSWPSEHLAFKIQLHSVEHFLECFSWDSRLAVRVTSNRIR